MHADHHLGLLEVLSRRATALEAIEKTTGMQWPAENRPPRWPWWPWDSSTVVTHSQHARDRHDESMDSSLKPATSLSVGEKQTSSLLVIGPKHLHEWLSSFAKVDKLVATYCFVDVAAFTPDSNRYRRYHDNEVQICGCLTRSEI